MTLTILYFAAARERIGTGREEVTTDAATLADLMAELATKSDRHAALFADPGALRYAVDQELAQPDTPLGDAREIAFFPPMTGG